MPLMADDQPPKETLPVEDAVASDWFIGDVILDLYEVTGFLGEGGMGKVNKVHHRGWDIDLAVKSPKPEIFAQAGGKENFLREAETWVNLGLHPHTVSCYYVRTLGGIPRVFAEYVEGGSLADWIRTRRLYEGGPEKALERILDIAIQFAWGLNFAHEHAMVHQDVKPANVMLTEDGMVKVTDFGLAKASGVVAQNSLARTSRTILVSSGGMTPAYCSPEQACGDPLSRKTDIWSWGLSLLEMFTGEVTWRAGQAASQALESYREVGAGAEALPHMPETLAGLLEYCFARDPQNRPPHMQDIAAELVAIFRQATGRTYDRAEPKLAEMTADVFNNRALSYLDLGKEEEGRLAWRSALAANPQHAESIYNRGMSLWRRAEITDRELVNQLEAAITTSGDSWEAKRLLGLVHLERGDAPEAILALSEAARDAPEDAGVDVDLAKARSCGGGIGLGVRTLEGRTRAEAWQEPEDQRALGQSILAGFGDTVHLSADGQWALSGSWDKTLKLWEVATGRYVRIFEGHTDAVTAVCLSLDGRWALSGSWDDTLKLWDVATGQCVRTFEGHAGYVSSVCLSADGQWAISGSCLGKTLKFWEVATGRCVRTIKGDSGHVNSVCLSADGRWALSGSRGKTLKLWEVTTGHCMRTFEGHTDAVIAVCLGSDGRWALSGSVDKTLRLWDVATGQCVRVCTLGGYAGFVSAICLSADGRWALSTGRRHDDQNDEDDDNNPDRALRLWDVATGRCVRTFEGCHSGLNIVSPSGICLSADGSWALRSEPGALRLWEISLPALPFFPALRLSHVKSHAQLLDSERKMSDLLKVAGEALREARYVSALTVLSEARAVPERGREPKILDMWAELSLVSQKVGLRGCWTAVVFEGHASYVSSVCLSADGQWALSGSGDKTLKLWDVSTGCCVRTFEAHTAHLSSVCLSADGRWAISEALGLWEVATGRRVRTLEGDTHWMTSVCLSADGRWALSGGGDKTPRLWEVDTGRHVRSFEGHTHEVSCVCLSTDGRWALSGDRYTPLLLRLWDVATGRCVRTFEGHTQVVVSVCMSADGRWALSGSEDTTLRLWEVATGQCVRILEGHTDQVWSVCMSADGRWALSGSRDTTLRLWRLDWELEAHDPVDWDDAANPWIENFLVLTTPYASTLPADRVPKNDEVTLALTRRGKPIWTDADFQYLLYTLGCAGYGWLRPEGVKRELEKMAAEWKGPPPLPGEIK